ncbi:MAG: DUF5615 family PIN-like protein [bacterium]|nr:DUF5615 family PIN-like protein [bacterium]
MSSLKFLIDIGVGKSTEDFFHIQGYDAKTVRSIDPRMTDSDIIRLAVREERIVITMDKDFGELVYHSSMVHSGIILLRLEDASGDEKLEVIKEIINKYSEKIKDHFCVYQRDKFRVRNIR